MWIEGMILVVVLVLVGIYLSYWSHGEGSVDAEASETEKPEAS